MDTFKKKSLLISNITNFINSNEKLKKTFNHRNNKYSINVKLKYVIKILTQGLTYRNSVQNSRNKICWSTIYNF